MTDNLYLKLSVLEALAKVNQSGHKCNTEIKNLIEEIILELDVVTSVVTEDEA